MLERMHRIGKSWSVLETIKRLYDIDINLEEFREIERNAVSPTAFKETSYWNKFYLAKAVKKIPVGQGFLFAFNTGHIVILPPILNVYWSIDFIGGEAKPETWNEGEYIVIREDYWEGQPIASTRCKTESEATEWIRLWKECRRKIEEYRQFKEMEPLRYCSTGNELTVEQLKQHYQSIVEKAKEIEELEKEEQRKKLEALQTRVRMLDSSGKIYEIDCLDGNTYTLVFPAKVEREEWTPFVYQHRYSIKKVAPEETLSHLLDLMERKGGTMTITVNGRTAEIEKRTFRNRTVTTVNSVRIRFEALIFRLHDYLFSGIELPRPQGRKKTFIEEVKVEGTLNTAVEERMPVSFVFRKEDNAWRLFVGRYNVVFKGDINTIKRLKNIVEGRSNPSSERHCLESFVRVLGEHIAEDPWELLKEARRIGKLRSVLGNEE